MARYRSIKSSAKSPRTTNDKLEELARDFMVTDSGPGGCDKVQTRGTVALRNRIWQSNVINDGGYWGANKLRNKKRF